MLLNQFNGGLNTRVQPQLLQANQATKMVNVDTSTETLAPRKENVNTVYSLDRYFTYFDNGSIAGWYSTPDEAYFTEYRNTLYMTDQTEGLLKLDAYNGTPLPIMPDTPTVDITISDASLSEVEVADVTLYGVGTVTDYSYILGEEYPPAETYASHVIVDTQYMVVPAGVLLDDVSYMIFGQAFTKTIPVKVTTTTVPNTYYQKVEIFGLVSDGNFHPVYGDTWFVFREQGGTFYLDGSLTGINYYTTSNSSDVSGNDTLDYVLANGPSSLPKTVIAPFTQGQTVEYFVRQTQTITLPDLSTVDVTVSETFSVFVDIAGGCYLAFNVEASNNSLELFRNQLGIWKEADSLYITGGSSPFVVEDRARSYSVPATTENPGFPIDFDCNYLYTYTDSAGTESAPSEVAEVLYDGTLKVTMLYIPYTSDSSIATVTVYRQGGAFTSYTELMSFANVPASAGVWKVDDGSIDPTGNEVLQTQNLRKPTGELKYLISAYATLFGAEGSTLWFSDPGLPDQWQTYNFIDFDAEITGLAKVPAGLLVFSLYQTYILTGTDLATFSAHLLSSTQGCVNHDTVAYIKGQALWVSKDGICASGGGDIVVITRPLLSSFSAYSATVNACSLNDIYYLSYDTGVLVVDFRFGTSIRLHSDSGYVLAAVENTRYGLSAGTLQLMEASSQPASITWKSPMYTEGDILQLKYIDSLKIMYTGSVTLKVYNQASELLHTEALNSANVTVAAISTNLAVFGYQLQLEGTGTVYSIATNISRGNQSQDSLVLDRVNYLSYLNNGVLTQTWKSSLSDMALKEIDGLRAQFVGSVELSIYMDGALKKAISLSSTTEGVEFLRLPRLSGYLFEVIATGEIRSLALTVIRSQNDA